MRHVFLQPDDDQLWARQDVTQADRVRPTWESASSRTRIMWQPYASTSLSSFASSGSSLRCRKRLILSVVRPITVASLFAGHLTLRFVEHRGKFYKNSTHESVTSAPALFAIRMA